MKNLLFVYLATLNISYTANKVWSFPLCCILRYRITLRQMEKMPRVTLEISGSLSHWKGENQTIKGKLDDDMEKNLICSSLEVPLFKVASVWYYIHAHENCKKYILMMWIKD